MDTSNEFRGLEWFRHVVIGTQGESHHLIKHLIANRQDQNGSRQPLLPNLATDVESVAIRQNDIEDNQVEGQISCLLQPLMAILGNINNVAFSAKANFQCRP